MWVVKHKPNQPRWRVKESAPLKRWRLLEDDKRKAQCELASTEPLPVRASPVVPSKNNLVPPWKQKSMSQTPKARRIPASGEPLAFCARCGEWTPMRWLPKEERGHAPETWFECEYCGCRELRLRYLAVKTAVPMPSINQALK